MTAEKDLHTLLATMHPELREGEFVYVLWPHGRPLAGAVAAAVREAEGLTVVLPRAEADSLGLPYDFVGAWITLQVHSSLEAIGLTAAVSAALTEAKISCNVLAGFHHDHILVPVADADRALEVLHELVAASGEHKPAPELVLRSEQPADRPAILALTAAAFAVSPVTGLPVEGEPEEVELLRALFDCEEYLPDFSIVAVHDGEVVGHVISTRGRAGELALLGLGPIGVVPATAAPWHRQRAHEGNDCPGQRRGGARHSAAGRPGVLLPLRLRDVDVPRRRGPRSGLGCALPAAAAGRLAGRRERNIPLRQAVRHRLAGSPAG